MALGAGASPRRDPAAPWRHIDIMLVFTTLAVAMFGVLMVYSATKHHNGSSTYAFFMQRQAAFVVLGLGVMVVASLVDYRIIRDFSPVIYIGTLVVLAGVLVVGPPSHGAQAWYQVGPFQFQPSEFAKIALVVCLAAYCAAHRGDMDLRRLIAALVLAGLPMLLIAIQPDLGTNLVFVVILLCTLLVTGVRGRQMAVLLALGVVAAVAVVQFGVLQKYQVHRLTSFVSPNADVRGATYNLDQSKTTIGSGGVFGKGIFTGPQTNLAYVPEQHTDFIFTAVGEQVGLVGSAALLALFAVMIWRIWRSANLAKDHAGTLICAGVLAMLVFQIFENVGMTMGIMPVTGIPLPFMSYGGSSTLATFAAIGLVLNVHMRRFS
jgi:rod shape determining protein RodA